MTPKFHSLRISDIRKETDDAVSIAFEVPQELRADYSFYAGQYLTLKAEIDGEDVRRSYSLCAAPFENEWRVAVKKVHDGRFSNYANNTLKKGALVDVMTPTGNFKLIPEKSRKKSYALFAAGSGITPILSIAKTALQEEPESDVTLIYGNKGFQTIIFREEIEALKNKYMDRLRVLHVLSRENIGNHLQKGRIDKEKAHEIFDHFLSDGDIDEVYICGPEEMIHGIKEALIEKGISGDHIHFELFTSPTAPKVDISLPKNSPKIESLVTIILDGDVLEIPLASTGKTILDASQEAGADLPFACKGGVCCTCKAKIIEGTVSMDVNYALEPDEVEAGYILTCQSHPTSKKLIVTFDE